MPQSPIPTLRLLEQLHAIAQIGRTYTTGPYDLERYEQLDNLYRELLGRVTDLDPGAMRELVPIEKGYLTPKCDVRAAVFREGEVLLCLEKADGRWTMPGGWGDVGVSPRENAEKELREETGYEGRATRLLALLDRDLHPHPKSVYHSYKYFFCASSPGERPSRRSRPAGCAGFPSPSCLRFPSSVSPKARCGSATSSGAILPLPPYSTDRAQSSSKASL